ncbi:MAG: UDP-diphosphatase [Evtepia sp.]|nr:UDP-diphosphatase [Evtepia sp.]
MNYITSVILGLVQGVAEFLPISSSGHLSLMQNLMGMASVAKTDIFFEVLLHFGTLIAVFIVYFRDIVDMVKDFFSVLTNLFSGQRQEQIRPTANSRMVLMLIVATLPLILILPIKDSVESLYGNTVFVGCALLVTGFFLFFSDRIQRGKKTSRTATMLDAAIVGLGQAIAVVPGLSRSGTTISLGMMRGFDRKFAVRFSFLLSIPAVLGANILEVGDAVRAGIDLKLIPIYLVGMLVSAIFGFFAIKLVNLLAQKGKFGKFAYYCWTIGLIAIVWSLIKG